MILYVKTEPIFEHIMNLHVDLSKFDLLETLLNSYLTHDRANW